MIPELTCDKLAANDVKETDVVMQELLSFWAKMNEAQRAAVLAFIKAFVR